MNSIFKNTKQLSNKNNLNPFSHCRILLLILLLFFVSSAVLATQTIIPNPFDTISLQFRWQQPFQFADYLAEKKQGYTTDDGLDMHIHAIDKNKLMIKKAVSPIADYVNDDVDIDINYSKRKLILFLRTVFQHHPVFLISKQSSNILSLFDFLEIRIVDQFAITEDTSPKAWLESIIDEGLKTINKDESNIIDKQKQDLQITQIIDINFISKYVFVIFVLVFFFIYRTYRIRQLRKSETALKASEAKLQLILDTEPACVKILDDKGRLLQINRAGLKMIDADNAKQLIGQKIDSLLLEEYRQAFNEMNTRVLSGESCTSEFPLKGLRGTIRWVESHSVPLIDEKTNIVSVLAVTHDITERKKTEESQNIAILCYQHTSEAMMVLDSNNFVISINPAFSNITGYNFNEIKGKDFQLLISERQEDDLYQEMWDSINNTGHWEGEIWNKRKNSELYVSRLVVNTITADNGKIINRIVLFSDITEKKEAEKLIWDQANFDPLTRLPNRNMFMDRLNEKIKIATRSQKGLALIFLDLDHFKEINDTLGHAMGDELLCETAKRLGICVRESDTVARLGGDEFVIILSEMDELHNIDRVAQSILQALSQFFILGDEQVHISASLGIALYPDDSDTIDNLIKYADQAMYLSKESGRGKFSYFTQSMQVQAQLRMHLMHDLHKAVAEKQFELYYQPIVDLTTGKINKAEALIRWNHPERGPISPVDFIPLAEDSGLIIDIGDWVFKQAAQQVKSWRSHYNKNLQISINKSPVQFRSASNRDDWLKYLKEIDLDGEGLAIEITESLLMEDASNISHQLSQYKGAGIQLSMDDFGTGYSSLSYLNKFDLDYLKIDRSFISNLTPSSNDMALTEAIILMSHKLGLKVIAEGIETEDQRKLLIANGCNYGQGYLFSRPVPADEFEKKLIDAKPLA